MKKLPVIFIFLLLTPSLCYAYVGPGVGLTVIASLLALGSAFFITLFGFIWLPIKRFFKGDDDDDSRDDSEESEESEETTDTDAGKDKNTDR
jgi:hypothetical protein